MSASIARNILIIGLMGTGKSSLARILSRKTGALLVDTDLRIEKELGMPISAVFAQHGEAFFRDSETKLLTLQTKMNGCIISTGGGMVIKEENRKILREMGLVVWLRASVETIFARVSRNKNRPLLHNSDPVGTLRKLAEIREPWYREIAHLEIDTGSTTRSASVETILRAAGWECKAT